MDEIKKPLVINKLQNHDIYKYLADHGMIGLNELYLIQNDDDNAVASVSYDPDLKKFYYTDVDGKNTDIVTMAILKGDMNLSAVATNGSYDSLSNQPKINNVTLSGNKTTADLHINYNQLENQPSIPALTQTYSSTDTSKAMTGKAVASALDSYTPESRTVTGTGALTGGGALTNNVTIEHKLAPTGLTPTASKVAVDSYGHVQIGGAITASDVQAQPLTNNVIDTCVGIDAAPYSTIMIIGTQDESVSFATAPSFGSRLRIYYVNITDHVNQVTIDPANFATSTYFFFNGKVLTQPYVYNVQANSNLCMEVTMIYSANTETPMVFTFADVIQDTGYNN